MAVKHKRLLKKIHSFPLPLSILVKFEMPCKPIAPEIITANISIDA
ncbi:MAG: hypothetical protein WC946_11215 [Bacteroidales bacterium]